MHSIEVFPGSLAVELTARNLNCIARIPARNAAVVGRFPDGTTQLMDEVKFIYDCASHAFAHVAMTSAMGPG